MAIGKPEHPGRVRGVGRGFGIGEYFGRASKKATPGFSREEVKMDVIKEIGAEWWKHNTEQRPSVEKLYSFFDTIFAESRPSQPHSYSPQQVHTQNLASTSPASSPAPSPAPSLARTPDTSAQIVRGFEGDSTVPLFVANNNVRKLVAFGIIIPSQQLHGATLGNDLVKVEIKTVEVEFAPLPIPPNDEITLVCQALGTFVAWPKVLVGEISDDEEDDDEEDDDEEDDDTSDPIEALKRKLTTHFADNNTVAVNIPSFVTNEDEMVIISREEVNEIITGHDWLSVPWVQLAIW